MWRLRALVLLLGVVLLAAPGGKAKGKGPGKVRKGVTYCVGGFSGNPPGTKDACGGTRMRQRHGGRWHHHNYVTDGNQCYSCWDEVDNTCETSFLKDHPKFRVASPGKCKRIGNRNPNQIKFHVRDGRPVSGGGGGGKSSKGNKGKKNGVPTKARAKVTDVSPGPYTAGDTIEMTGEVVDARGNDLPVAGGRFVVITDEGKRIVVPGKVRDGAVVGQFKIPTTGGLKITFEPGKVKKKGKVNIATDARKLNVQACRYRARVVSPKQGAVIVSDSWVDLEAELLDARTGKVLTGSARPRSPRLTFTMHITGQRRPDEVKGGKKSPYKARWSATDPKKKQAKVRFTVGGQAKGGAVCPVRKQKRTATLTGVGLELDTSEVPSECWTDSDCPVSLAIKRPRGSISRQVADALLDHPQTVVEVYDGNRLVSAKRRGDRFRFSSVWKKPGQRALWLRIVHPDRTVDLGPAALPIRQSLELRLPASFDLGAHDAGSDLFSTCSSLRFEGEGVEDFSYNVWVELPPGCKAEPVTANIDATTGLPFVNTLTGMGTTIDELGSDGEIGLCLQLPRCDDEVRAQDVVLHVQPTHPRFADQATTVALEWRVRGTPLWLCWIWLWLPILVGIVLAVILYGFVRPAAFDPEDGIRMAGSERTLRRAATLRLREMPGSRRGWYRNARLGLHGDASLNGRVQGAAVILRATHEGLILEAKSRLEQRDRRTKKWVAVEDPEEHVPAPGQLYRTGSLYFTLEI